MASDYVGTIEEIWRYPVSSLGGERLDAVEIEAGGVPGDREWCLVDVESGRPAAPEMDRRWHPALFLQSRRSTVAPEIGFPDGQWLAIDNDGLKSRLEAHFGFAVEPRPYAGTNTAGLGTLATATNRYPPSPLHVLTTGSIDHLASLAAKPDISSRRFRPTVLLRTDQGGDFVEKSWIGQALQLGATTLQATDEARRCGFTLIAQPGLDEEPEILRTVVRHNRRNFGIYCAVSAPGRIAVGDRAFVIR